MMRFDRFTECAQFAAMLAYELMQRYGHTQVDTEHVLLALLEQPAGIIPEICKHLGVDPEDIWRQVDKELKLPARAQTYGLGRVDQVYITPRLKRVIDQSHEEASKLEDDNISTEHLLLAIAMERNTPSARILASRGASQKRVLEILTLIRGEATQLTEEARPTGRRRARLMPVPLEDVTIEVVTGDEPAVVLIQGEQTITVQLAQVLALVGALANAATNLAELTTHKK